MKYRDWIIIAMFLGAGHSDASELDKLTLSIECGDKSILKCEPLPLKIALRNEGKNIIETTLGVARFAIESRLSYSLENGAFVTWERGWLSDRSFPPLKRLRFQPWQSDIVFLDCFWQETTPIFGKAGNYRVKAVWQGSLGPAGTIDIEGGVKGEPIERESTIEVTVIEGAETDKKCLEYMISHNIQGYLSIDSKEFLFVDTKTMSIEKTEKEKIDTLKSLYHVAQNFKESRYSIYALATLLSVLDNKVIDDKFRKAILELADQRVSDRKDSTQVQADPFPRVLYTYAQYLFGKDAERALTLLRKAKDSSPDFVVAEKIESLLKKIEWEQKTKDWTPKDWQEYHEKRAKDEEAQKKEKTDSHRQEK